VCLRLWLRCVSSYLCSCFVCSVVWLCCVAGLDVAVAVSSLPTSQFDTLENSLHKVQRETHELHQQVSLLSGESGFNIDAAAKKVHSFSMRHNVDELLSTVKVRTRYITAQHSTAQHILRQSSPVQSECGPCQCLVCHTSCVLAQAIHSELGDRGVVKRSALEPDHTV
jgi:hypothetical protein